MAARCIHTAASFDLLTVITFVSSCQVICMLTLIMLCLCHLLAFIRSILPAGREKEQVRKDIGRNRYFTPPQAIEYGLIDRIVQPEDAVAIEEKNYELLLQQANAQQKGQQRVPAGASAEGGY